MDKALHQIIDASFTGPDGLDYVETEVALNVARSVSNWTPASISKWESILEMIDRQMECTLESDPRNWNNRECEYGWLFDRIHEWRNQIKRLY